MRKMIFGGIALVSMLAAGMVYAREWPTHTLRR